MKDYRDDKKLMERVLPAHYTCKLRPHGVHCVSSEGIREDQGYDDHWDLIVKAIKQNFGDRLQEIFHNTCTNHVDFTVYLKRIPEMEKKLEAARKLASTSVVSGWHTPSEF